MGEAYTVNSESKKESFKEFVDELYEKKPYITFTYQHGKPRTPAQNNAMHVFCQQIADRCNAAGYWYKVSSPILKADIETPWTKERVKKLMWMAVQQAMYPDTTSTRDLTTEQMVMVADTLSLHLSDKHKIYVKFPTKDDIDGNQKRRSG